MGLRPGPGPIDNSSFLEFLVEKGSIDKPVLSLKMSRKD
jgi:hypothetical protein